MRSKFLTPCTISYTRKKVASRSQLYADPKEHGRSMVEMLGVLAIIGVLSVGAIAGYSKAMMKYRLNKFSESVNILINNSLQLKDKVARGTDMHLILEKTNSLPDGIYRLSSYLVDKYFKTSMYIYRNSNANPPYGGIGYEFAASAEGREICRAIVTAAKENAADLWLVEVGKKASQDVENLTYVGHLFGDAYCGEQQKCLRKLTLDNIDALCSPCVAGTYRCTIFTLWSI